MIDLERILRSIGKECFVDYYDDFRNCTDNSALAQKLLDNNDRAKSISAQATRVNKAKKIFENGLEKEALDNIINSDRVQEEAKAKARILRNKA